MVRRAFLWLLFVAVASAVTVDLALQWGPLTDGYFRQRRVAPFDPPLFNAAQADRLAHLRTELSEDAWEGTAVAFDAELGWAPRRGWDDGTRRYDWAGARIASRPLARTRDGRTRVVAVGGSFTHGDEVAGDQTWLAHVARRLGVEVGNLGVGAYGIDQALLRWRRDGVPLAPDEVWLGFMPSAVLRVVTMYRPALRHHDRSLGIKPRFVLDEGALRLVASPARRREDVVRLLDDQRAFLEAFGEHDLWVARAPDAYAPRGSRVLHHTALGREWLTRREAAGRDPAPWLNARQTEVYALCRRLVLALHEEVRAAAARFRLIVLPDRKALVSRARGEVFWQDLLDELADGGVEVVDLVEPLHAGGALGDAASWAPHGHYSARGNARVAEALLDRVRDV